MPNISRGDIHNVDEVSYPYIYEENASILLKSCPGLIRCNVYRPRPAGGKYPVLVTYGPYGKDVPYEVVYPQSYAELPADQRSAHAAFETPDPGFWTSQSYAIVRADERGTGQSQGYLDPMSRNTTDAFVEIVEWAAAQSWSNGKVGLLGVSYYAASQWRVAARQPRGLACIIPWEGMSDYYRDCCRHGGILSERFIKFWWERYVLSSQYGKRERPGQQTLEGDLLEEELRQSRNDQNEDVVVNRFRDEAYYASKEYDLSDVQVPVLSVGNWGGIMLHLRGNVQGYIGAGSKLKYLRFISGRHDLPFYDPEEVKVQLSFLDAFLKGEDRGGWTNNTAPPVDIILRKGNVGFNNPEGEKRFQRRPENEWPIARTRYIPYYLTPQGGLITTPLALDSPVKLGYKALGSLDDPQLVQFITDPFDFETEITGHIVAHLNVSMAPVAGGPVPSDIDLFLTLRHLDPHGKEILYTGTAGDGVPICKGWLRVSLRKTNPVDPQHKFYLPYRDYFTTDVLPVIPGEVYAVDVEIWPTNVVMEEGDRLVFEVASGDTQGCGISQHSSPVDRAYGKLAGRNFVHWGPGAINYVTLPIIPLR